MTWKVIDKVRTGKIFTIVLLNETSGEVKSEAVSIYQEGDKKVREMREKK